MDWILRATEDDGIIPVKRDILFIRVTTYL